jgi:hypothetical protein
LLGKLFDEAGRPLTTSHTRKNGRLYRYYISSATLNGNGDNTAGWRLPAKEIETIVADLTAQCLADRAKLAAVLETAGIPANAISATFKAADGQQRQLRSETQRDDALAALIKHIELRVDSVRLTLSLAPLVPQDGPMANVASPTLARDFPLQIKRRGVEMRLVIENAPVSTSKRDPILLREVARAYRCFETFATGKVVTMSELSSRENVDERYVRRLLPLAFLAPDIVNAIITGSQPADLTAQKLMRKTAISIDWQTQKLGLGFT